MTPDTPTNAVSKGVSYTLPEGGTVADEETEGIILDHHNEDNYKTRSQGTIDNSSTTAIRGSPLFGGRSLRRLSKTLSVTFAPMVPSPSIVKWDWSYVPQHVLPHVFLSQQSYSMKQNWKHLLYTAVVQVLIPVAIAFATIFIPLWPITKGFSKQNVPFLALYLPALSLNYAIMQYPWYHHLCYVKITQMWPGAVYIVLVTFANAIPMWMNEFPLKLYPGLSMVGLWISVLPLMMSYEGYRLKKKAAKEQGVPFEAKEAWIQNFQFWIFIMVICGYQVIAFAFMVFFSLGGPSFQITAKVLFAMQHLAYRKLVLHVSDNNPLSLYWIEFTYVLFQYMVIPSISNYGVFAFFLVAEVFGLIVRLVRLTEVWWLVRTKLRLWAKNIVHFVTCKPPAEELQSIIIQNSLAIIASTVGIRASEPKRQDYMYYVCYGLFFVIVSEMLSPFVFVFLTLLMRYGYNAEFYPYNPGSISNETFFRAQIFAAITLAVNVGAFFATRKFIQVKYGMDYLHIGFDLVKKDFVLILVDNLHAICFPISLLLLHMNLWWFYFRKFPVPSGFLSAFIAEVFGPK